MKNKQAEANNRPVDEGKVQRATVGIKEAARILGIGKNQAYAAARKGELPVLRIGGRILVSRVALERMLLEMPILSPASNLR